MVPTADGVHVPESKLAAWARMDPKGTPSDELERLVGQYDLVTAIPDTTVEGLRRILADGHLPIAFIDRAVFDLTPRRRARHSIRNAVERLGRRFRLLSVARKT